MSRKPLSVRNSDNPPRGRYPGGDVPKKKKGRNMFVKLDVATLVSQLNLIFSDCPGTTRLVEEDLRRPIVRHLELHSPMYTWFCASFYRVTELRRYTRVCSSAPSKLTWMLLNRYGYLGPIVPKRVPQFVTS